MIDRIFVQTDSKEHLLKAMKGEDSSPIKTGKGCRKRINNVKYLDDIEEESEDLVIYSIYICEYTPHELDTCQRWKQTAYLRSQSQYSKCTVGQCLVVAI